MRTALEAPRPENISVFVGTWNMAEQALPEKISDWIPGGRDIYAVGLQECMDARSVRGGFPRPAPLPSAPAVHVRSALLYVCAVLEVEAACVTCVLLQPM
jgi:hypothetical protein